jgi:hypothetical protein
MYGVRRRSSTTATAASELKKKVAINRKSNVFVTVFASLSSLSQLYYNSYLLRFQCFYIYFTNLFKVGKQERIPGRASLRAGAALCCALRSEILEFDLHHAGALSVSGEKEQFVIMKS